MIRTQASELRSMKLCRPFIKSIKFIKHELKAASNCEMPFAVIQVTDDEEEESEFLSARPPELGFGFGTEISDGSASADRETSTTSDDDDDGDDVDRSTMVINH